MKDYACRYIMLLTSLTFHFLVISLMPISSGVARDYKVIAKNLNIKIPFFRTSHLAIAAMPLSVSLSDMKIQFVIGIVISRNNYININQCAFLKNSGNRKFKMGLDFASRTEYSL